MSEFKIDFFELAFLAEACIPPRPIARTMFWQNLTSKYWHQMTEDERERLFDWMNKSEWYKKSLEEQEDTQIFHARFDPDNQYIVSTDYNGKLEEHRAFKMWDRYYTSQNTSIQEQYITKIEKYETNSI
jgi:hypothetical protein